MSFDMFVSILDKIAAQKDIIPKIDLYNWGEPSLHKQLPEFIEEINRRGWFSNISSNLNTSSIDRLIEVPPTKIRLSVSGYDQARYGITHEKGNIDQVKSNWHRLVHLKKKRKLNTTLEVAFHVYKNNKTDLLQWAALALQSGAVFSPVWSIYQPLEELVEVAINGSASEKFHSTTQMMEVGPLEQLAAGRDASPNDCRLRYKQTAINWDGSVSLCCGIYDYKQYTISNSFLDTDWDELQRRKYQHSFCEKCFKAGGPGTIESSAQSKINEIAIQKQIERNTEFIVSIDKGINITGNVDLNKIFFQTLS
jgi:MoaA/NifB/PqqE/SkfB family radical SAM enzyme